MKLNKNLMIVLSSILILLFFIGSACAVDTNESNALSVDETVNIEDNNEIVFGGASDDTDAVKNDEVTSAEAEKAEPSGAEDIGVKEDLSWEIDCSQEVVSPGETFYIAIWFGSDPDPLPTGTVTMRNPGVDIEISEKIALRITFETYVNEDSTITIEYSGDDYYNAKTEFIDMKVISKKEKTEFKSFKCPTEVKKDDVLEISFSLPTPASGGMDKVWLNIDGSNVVDTMTDEDFNGHFEFIGLDSGKHEVKLVFEGNDGYEPCESDIKIVTVSGSDKMDLTLEAVADPIMVGDNATVVISGFEDASGDVSVRAGDGVYFAPIVGGVATVVVPGLIANTTALI